MIADAEAVLNSLSSKPTSLMTPEESKEQHSTFSFAKPLPFKSLQEVKFTFKLPDSLS